MNTKTDLAASDDPAASSAETSSLSSAGSSNTLHPVPPPPNPNFALFIATAGGLGYFPKAPGTWGSLIGVILALVPSWIFFSLGAARIAIDRGNNSVFLKTSTWYADPFLLGADRSFTSRRCSWGLGFRSRFKTFPGEGSPVRRDRRGVGTTPSFAAGMRNTHLVEERDSFLDGHANWFDFDAFRPQLEIFAPGFYTFSSVRYLEAVPGAANRVVARRLGYHGG